MSQEPEMTCAEIRERLPLVPGADLLPAEDRVVRAHLAACHACRRELGGYVRLRGELRGLGEAPVVPGVADPATFFADLRRDTLAAIEREAAPRRRVRRRMHASMGGMMTAAALFLLGVYLFSLWPRGGAGDFPLVAFPGGEEPARMRSIGLGPYSPSGLYGLSGHREQYPTLRVPLMDLPVTVELAPERDADAAVLRDLERWLRSQRRHEAGLSTGRSNGR